MPRPLYADRTMLVLLAVGLSCGVPNMLATSVAPAWTTVTSTWDRWTGRTIVSWGANAFYVDGAGIGSIADETDIYATRNGSAVAATVYFDDMVISTEVPAPGALALLGLAGIAGSRRRR